MELWGKKEKKKTILEEVKKKKKKKPKNEIFIEKKNRKEADKEGSRVWETFNGISQTINVAEQKPLVSKP